MHSSRRPTGRLVSLTAASSLGLAAFVVPAASAADYDDDVVIDIIGINDFHGRIESGFHQSPVAGAAVLAGAVRDFRAANENTIFVSAGDNIGASTFTSFVAGDQPTIDVLNEMGLEVAALGNHEFDQGRVDVDDRVIPASDFPLLGANIYEASTGEPAYDEYWVKEVDGVRVGFIGANTEDLPALVSPAGIRSLEVGSIVDATNRVAAQLTDGDEANGEADVVVLLVHEGPPTSALADVVGENNFGEIVTGLSDDVHAIFSGHTHLQFAYQLPVEGWADGLTRPVVHGGQYGEALAHVQLTVDRDTKQLVDTASAVVPLGTNTATPPANANWVANFEPVASVQAIVDAAVAQANELGAVRIGEVTADIRRAVQSNGTTENRGGESTLGNLVADMQLWATSELDTEIAFMNPGGLRADLVYGTDGTVTFRQAAVVQPFANTLVTMDLTGRQVVAVLEEQWQPEGASRPFLKLGVAGATYTYDPTAARGERITEVFVGDERLDLDASYRVVVNSFLAAGGDNFFTLAEGTDRADSGRVDLQAAVDFMNAQSPVSPDLAQRAVGVRLVDAPADGYAAGDEVEVHLSSLLFSRAAGQGDEVVLSIGGEEVARSAIDPTVVDATDEQGRAHVTFTVPAGLTGEVVDVEVTVPGSGTATSFRLPLAAVVVAPSCVVDYAVTELPRTFRGLITVTNASDVTLERWRLGWTFGHGETVVSGNGARFTQDGSSVTATSVKQTSTVAPGESVEIRVVGKHGGTVGGLSDVTLDGVACAAP
jgi:5'-nucleotidase